MSATWPPAPDEARLLDRLAALIARGGAARFLDVPVVRADPHDFPEPWTPTRAALERLLLRLCWLSYVDLDVEVDDVRAPGLDDSRLRETRLEWIETTDGAAVFQLETIGNDDIAGLAAHELGRAYLAWIGAGDPYREVAPEPPSAADGSLAAVYLGLGVLAARSAVQNRHASEVIGNGVRWERAITVRGGLAVRELTYLLAVQAVCRQASVDTLATLPASARDEAAAMIVALRPHRAALLARLELDPDAPRPRLERDPAPATVTDAERPEPDLRRTNVGKRTYRIGRPRAVSHSAVATLATLPVWVAASWLGAPKLGFAVVGVAWLGGLIVGMNRMVYRCADRSCEAVLPRDAAVCPGCGGTVAGEVASDRERIEREWEREDAGDDRSR